jgi:serine protease Do
VAEQLSAAGLPQPPSRRPQDPPGEPGEVVEYYYQPTFGREVVECYVQPGTLPGRRSARSAPPKRRRRTGLWIFLAVLAVLVAAVIAAAVWRANTPPSPPADGSQQETPDWEEPDSSATVSIPTYKADAGVQLTIADSHGAALTAQQVYERVNPAVVSVIVQLKEGASIGTGILFTQDGYLLTNYHVVAGGTDCSVALNNDRQYTARYVAGDSKNDIAILKVEGSHLPTAEFGSSDALEVGDTVYAIGNPLGVELRGTFTNGIVSAINRDVKVDDRTMTLIQTNAALNSGNSGGPLINCYGQVVGINTIKMSSAFSTVEGLGFAIPSVSVASLADDLLTTGSVLSHETRLGISVSSFGIQLQDGTWGVEVLEVSTPSPAADAGIRKGDVIVSAGGQSVSSSRELLNVRRQYRAGQSLPVKVWRSGEYLNFSLKLAEAAS